MFKTFPLYLISFTLAISIFNKSILSFGYIIFVMVIIANLTDFFESDAGSKRLYNTLNYFLMPYLLFDIFLTILFQMPYIKFDSEQTVSMVIGVDRIWEIKPEILTLG